MPELPSGTLTFLFTDIEGSTKLLHELGVEGYAEALPGRESEVLGLLAQGLTQDEIAARLLIKPKTVSSHIEHVLRKLGVHSRAQAVALAFREDAAEVAF